jgi:hypothetical protein
MNAAIATGRVVLFWSDKRVPHEVLPTNVDRFTVTVWYFDGIEKAQADEFARRAATASADGGAGSDAVETEEERRRFLQEQERIRAEIRKFEELAGAAGSAVVLADGDGITTTPTESTVDAGGGAAATGAHGCPSASVAASESGAPPAQRAVAEGAVCTAVDADTDLFELD